MTRLHAAGLSGNDVGHDPPGSHLILAMKVHPPARDHEPMDDPSSRAAMTSTFALGSRQVRRSGYGAMQLAGPFAFGPPPDRAAAIGVLRAAVAAGVDHIDTGHYAFGEIQR